MLTEEEAKTKWCPYSRVIVAKTSTGTQATVDRLQAACNRIDNGPATWAAPDASCCIGRACMAWRWFDGVSDDGTTIHRAPTHMRRREPEPKEGRPMSERTGYCGLVGKP